MTEWPPLAAHRISKRYGSTQALQDVSLAVSGGQVLALLGENGAGKSTLVKILSGVVQPDEGEIRVDGASVGSGPRAAEHFGIHLVHQELALLPDRTVVENIFVGNELRSRLGVLDGKRMRRLASDALSELGAVDVEPTSYIRDLPTGSQQMVEIARAIVGEARFVILDEPTAALSPSEAERLFEVVRRMTQRGVGVIYISHRLEEILEIADIVTVLKDGRHVSTAPIDGLTVDDMVALMVGRDIEDLFPEPREASGGPRDPALVVEGLCDADLIQEASFAAYPGEIVGIYGLEGHGQDEILACLAGVRRPASGRLTVRGEAKQWGDVAAMTRDGFGYVPADRKTEGLILNFSGDQNVTLPLLRGLIARGGLVASDAEHRVARSASTAAGVRGDLSRPVSSLSGGNQQKVLLARLIAAESTILLLNQPTRGVDIGAKAEIYALVRRLCNEKDAVAVVVSREIGELLGLCDRILVMSNGRLAGEHPRTATEAEILATAVGASA